MTGKRLRQTIRMYLTPGSGRRTAYLRKEHIFAAMGNNCSVMDRKVPLYAGLISLGNNVHIASKVDFITHDITHVMLNNIPEIAAKGGVQEKIGCIVIGDNVFIGSNTMILSNVRIGSNVVIGAGSLVNRDIPDNTVAAGVPAKPVGSFDAFVQKRLCEEKYPAEWAPEKQTVGEELKRWCRERFQKSRQQ